MRNDIEPSLEKRTFYSQPEVAQAYDELRFGSASGEWVNRRELDLVQSLLGACDRVLDLACGTGRLTRALSSGASVVGVDSSGAMLAQARGQSSATFVEADAFALPFADGAFMSIVALRFAFHFPRPDELLKEARRSLAPGGTLVFDTYLWSPRAWLPLDRGRWGGQVYAYSPRTVEQAAAAFGYRVQACRTCFLFSPYLYRRLPLPLVQGLDRVERRVPPRLHARAFWKLVAASK